MDNLEDVSRWVAVIVPDKPPIDKIGAVALVERRRAEPIENVRFDPIPDCTIAQLAHWREENILPIDIGPEKYNRSEQFGSAAEAVVTQLYLRLNVAEQRFVFLLNKNNATGHLKQPHMAIPLVLRELYELPQYDDAEVFARAVHVVEVYLSEQELEEFERKDATMAGEERLAALLEQVKKCSMAPFTPAAYARGMWRLGYAVEDICEKAGWWIAGWKRIKEEQGRMEEYARNIKWQTGVNQFLGRNGLIVRILETDRDQLVKLVARSIGDVLVVRKTTGHSAVLTNGADLRELAQHLCAQEPGQWYYALNQGMLLNGGRNYSKTTPTSFSLFELKDMVVKFPPISKNRRW